MIYDITQPLFECEVFPGDTRPEKKNVRSIKKGDVTAQDAKNILEKATKAHEGAQKKILIKGKATITLEAAKVFAEAGIDLVGNESQTVGPEDGPMAVHLGLLGAEVVLLEGIRLSAVPDGVYVLNCAPLNLTDTDGAPCRAILMDLDLE